MVDPLGHWIWIPFDTIFWISLRGLSDFLGDWIPYFFKGIFWFLGYPGIGSSINMTSVH